MKIKKLWFKDNCIYILNEENKEYKQSLLWYSQLLNASAHERENYSLSPIGIHWRNLNEDISFESFQYKDAIPTALQEFFLRHKEINITEFAKRINMNATLLRNYINGFKTPSKKREEEILNHIHQIGREYSAVKF